MTDRARFRKLILRIERDVVARAHLRTLLTATDAMLAGRRRELRSLKARVHVNKIVALADIYGGEKVARAIEDAIASEAFASQYIENILQQRERLVPQPGPLHLTRRSDLLDLELSPADLSLYDNQ